MSAPCPVFAFQVVFHLAPGLGEEAARALWDAFVAGPVGGRGLVCEGGEGVGGGAATGRRPYLVRSEAAQATDDDRRAVAAWASARPEIVEAEVGPLVDVASAV